ncbi:MAG: hypothetical protein B6242_11605 [Anaerolineaceae bacterium 4572_78]|nr:MAG: hypothetical protein B6242_11605 [Anaerolineaceae bacterium 4572_78]
MGQEIAQSLHDKKPIFSYTFGQNVDEGEIFLSHLGQFLSQRGYFRVSNHVKQATLAQKQISWNHELATKLHLDLTGAKAFIWLDDLHVLQAESLTTTIVTWLFNHKPNMTQLLLTSRKLPYHWQHTHAEINLSGLTNNEMDTWFSAIDILHLNDSQTEQIRQQTQGHPLLIKLFLMLVHGGKQNTAFTIFKNHETENVATLINHFLVVVWENLTNEEQLMMEQLSLLTGPEERYLIKRFVEADIENPEQILNQLHEKQLIALVPTGHVEKITISHANINQYTYQQIEDDNKTQSNLSIGKIYYDHARMTNSPEYWLKAGQFYKKGENHVQATYIFVNRRDDLLYTAYRQEYLQTLRTFKAVDLYQEQKLWQQLLETRAGIAFQLGYHADDGLALQGYKELYQLTKHPKWLLKQGRFYNFRRAENDMQHATLALEKSISESESEVGYLNNVISQIAHESWTNQQLYKLQQQMTMLKAQSQMEMVRVYWMIRDFVKAIDFLQQGMQHFEVDLNTIETVKIEEVEHAISLADIPAENWDSTAWALRYAGIIYVIQERPASAIACWLSARSLWQKAGDAVNVAATEINLGGVYEEYRLDLNASNYYSQSALVILEDHEDINNLMRLYSHFVGLSIAQGKLDNALQYLSKISTLIEQYDQETQFEDLGQHGKIYASIEMWESAKQKYHEAITLAEKNFDQRTTSYDVMNLADLYLAWGRVLAKSDEELAQTKYTLAEEKFKHYLTLDDEYTHQVNLGLAEIYIKTNRLLKAQAILESDLQIVKILPFFVPARINRVWGEWYQVQHDLANAEIKYLEAWNELSSNMNTIGIDKEEIWVLHDIIALYKKLQNETKQHEFETILDERKQIYILTME